MKYLSGLDTLQYAGAASSSSDIKYWINYLLYNESKTNRWNISADINVGNYEKVVVPLGKRANI